MTVSAEICRATAAVYFCTFSILCNLFSRTVSKCHPLGARYQLLGVTCGNHWDSGPSRCTVYNVWRKLSVRRLGPSDLLHTDVLHHAQLSICNTHRSARDETKRSAARPSLTATQRLPDSLLILLRALGRITAVITAIHLFFGRDGTYTLNVQNSCRDGTINTANYYQNQFFIHENMIFDQYGVQTFELPTVCGKSCYCCGNPHALIQAREVIDLSLIHI